MNTKKVVGVDFLFLPFFAIYSAPKLQKSQKRPIFGVFQLQIAQKQKNQKSTPTTFLYS